MTMFDRNVPNRCTWTRAPTRGEVVVDIWLLQGFSTRLE
jgi:hypothetical protein